MSEKREIMEIVMRNKEKNAQIYRNKIDKIQRKSIKKDLQLENFQKMNEEINKYKKGKGDEKRTRALSNIKLMINESEKQSFKNYRFNIREC